MKKIILMTLMILIGTTMCLFPCFAEEMLYGCYQKNNGQLRIVDNPSECRSSEVPISWNEIGPPGLIWQGPWNETTTYELDDAVSYNGSSYVSLVGSNIGYLPDLFPEYWEMLAQRGDPGIQGLKGDPGEIGPAGHSPVLTWSGDKIVIDGVPGPSLTGPQGVQGSSGHSPILTWEGDQIAIDSIITGPHLTGPQGPPGPPGTISSVALTMMIDIIDSIWEDLNITP